MKDVEQQVLPSKINSATNKAAVVAVPLLVASASHANDIDVGTLAVGGLVAAAAAVFAIKAGPALLMWGYNAIMGFLKRT